jgi:hypothetical protein
MTFFFSPTRLLLLCILATMSNLATAARTNSIVQVGIGDAALDLELSFPAAAKPRAIVVIVPGSGGLSDPYFDSEIRQPKYAYLHRGGITDMLTQAGYAVAAYSVRGYRGASCIPEDTAPAERAAYFVAHCADQDVRGKVSLTDITEDTKRIFSFLRQAPSTSGLGQIALAYSEGMFHVLDAFSGEMPDALMGIVAVGGPHDSLRTTLEYQLTRSAYFKLIDTSFARSKSSSESADEIMKANDKDATFNRAGLIETMGSDPIRRDAIPARQAYWRDAYRQLYDKFAPGTLEGTMDGVLDGVHIEKAWSIKYYSQLISDDRRPSEAYRQFKGSIIYMYGLDDVLVRIPSRQEFVAAERSAAGARRITLVARADHGLATGGMPSSDSLAQIARAIDGVVGDARVAAKQR